ncbi:heat-inducible transcriptional repressor HrcA [Halovulum dunhuangense]|uniref:Heat-inducible transcription repressor HrcA n=1 Tax=Halovulum dunhuangense TaxID=1505036 RepID=A0A849KZG9_9RHOB|nr:heat-inducible transcriptional repressor HrcA [Halovulum dunhuangense]NNU79084.1 heat-inducible transcriptional repressor HrcA [Halovulum dunhuangense]
MKGQGNENGFVLDARSRDIFKTLVESYLDTGEPVGSRTLSRSLGETLSPATIRNTMQDLEHLGLLDSPHVSAGRVPTQRGLRLFLDGFLQVGEISMDERTEIERYLDGNEPDLGAMLDRAGSLLSGLTHGASLVLAPKSEAPIRHVEFVSLSAERVLVVLVFADGNVENRLFTPPMGLTPSAMREAANFLNAVLEGRTLSDIRGVVEKQIEAHRRELDALAAALIETGTAVWTEETEMDEARLIVRGRSNLLGESGDPAQIDRIRRLFDDLERKRDLAQLLDLTEQGDGVRVFIGSENKLFSLSGSSLVVSPYMNAERRIVGAVGVIGPTRQNYGRIVPIVDYTAQLVGRLISRRNG